jgi:hypothetical protein
MMDDPLCREVVERLAVAGAGPRRISRLYGGRRRRRIRQCLGGQQIAAAARPARMPAAPDLGGPVRGVSRPVEDCLGRHHHRRADRLEGEFLLAAPAHPDRLPRPVKSDDRGIGCCIIGAVVAVAGRPLSMLDRNRRGVELQGPRQRIAQRVDALRVGPHREPSVAVLSEPAGRRHRGVGDVHPRIGRLVPGRRGCRLSRRRRADSPVDRGLLQQPSGFFLVRVDRVEAVPGDMIGCDGRDSLDHRLVGTEDREEIAVADDFDRPFRGPAQRGLVDLGDCCTAARLAHDARVHHAVENHVVDKSRSAEHLRGEIDARRVPPDDTIVADGLGWRPAVGISPQIDGRRERPVILAGRLAVLGDGAVAYCQIGPRIAETRSGLV